MTRVALYARYSSDAQRDASIEDQLRLCRSHAERQGWTVTLCYTDRAMSGASLLRPGIQELMQDAQRGGFDLVLAEALDRISRDQEDVAAVFKRLRFAGVGIVTLAEGQISELHVGLKGTMNALFLKDLAAKTHRGIRGRVEAGKIGGGLCYGYRVVPGAHGRGDREIVEAEAETVRRICREFAAGASPRAIARSLNAEGVPGPGGSEWTDSTIRGHVSRGTGILNNELYVGKLVWNRLRYIKDPSTGKRVSRINPQSEWITSEVPELRIVDDALWHAVKTRQQAILASQANAVSALQANRLNPMRRAKTLLSGLLTCCVCGGPYALHGRDRYACSTNVNKGTCSNGRTIDRLDLERRVLVGLKDRLLAPEAAAEAMRAYTEELNRRNQARRASSEADRHALTTLEKAGREIVTAIENGGFSQMLMDRLREIEAKQEQIRRRLAEAEEPPPDVHPNIAELFRRKVERLAEALNHPENRREAADALRTVIAGITLRPGPERGELHATLHGDLGTILGWLGRGGGRPERGQQKTDTPSGVSVSLVAGTGFEPVTFRL
ncbi:recombinase family protein [Inquilinus limosus]|uniref:recombinase family protein n=1 Tax=Inquilinus limosus TaxID=171674 RepID=UPI003F13FE55